ncbi:PAS-domain containing protein [Sulfitobacter sabulilitoris]|uniref:PAS domain-containing protein n=1 Tax=Sulfitobacter sabulilitoris TaxID=2562655 RepID=A0A5S3PEV9_9RHOB|nr:PAS-domain containing protein [Sulfitobacter sabulilitoris]TMM52584.1 PAS domain-containing protein [Sulfitobacter sabulilitoris]
MLPLDWAVAGLSACISALVALWWLTKGVAAPAINHIEDDCDIAFVFHGSALHHASNFAEQALGLSAGRDDWTSMAQALEPRFPDLETYMSGPPNQSVALEAGANGDRCDLWITRNGDVTHAQVQRQTAIPARTSPPGLPRAKDDELRHLRLASETSPHPVWQTEATGHVVWHNEAYDRLYRSIFGDAPKPDHPVFQPFAEQPQTLSTRRVSTPSEHDGERDWYDVRARTVGGTTVFHAANINPVVEAEIAQRNFVQTLAKTFAQLSIGLAIFDRNRQLVLFNPALIDLTDLPADFLSARPTLTAFFDWMRENRRMPEPKNYTHWRQEIAEVIAAAADGRYQDTWTLETGQTYKVKGRPHPDGAIAFLIEDITAEMSVTRNFRAELEIGQSLIDTLEDALVVFSATGIVTFCNAAYRRLWGLDPDNSFADVTIQDSLRDWQKQCAPGTDMTTIGHCVMSVGDRDAFHTSVRRSDGCSLECHVIPLAAAASMVRFQVGAPGSRHQRPVSATEA